MNLLTRLYHHLFRNAWSSNDGASSKVVSKLRDIEASQAKMLQLLENLGHDEVPRNENRIYKIGRARTVYFLNDLLPQVYLTLVSVLEGVVLAILVGEFQFSYWNSRPLIYAYMTSSLMIIIAFWQSYLNAIFDGRWPFHLIDNALFFMAATTQAISVRFVSIPWQWCFAMTGMCLVVALVYFRQIPLLKHLDAQGIFENRGEAERRKKAVTTLGVFFLLTAMIAAFFVPVTLNNPNSIIAAVTANLIPLLYIGYSIRSAATFGIDIIG